MVSKIAVMALVAVVAVPILLGYGMNFETVQETRYEADNDPVNVTPLISSGTEYTYVSANGYELNARSIYAGGTISGAVPIQGAYPKYEKTTTAESSLKLAYRTGTFGNGATGYDPITEFVYVQADYIYDNPIPNGNAGITITVKDANNNTVVSTQNVSSFTYDKANKQCVFWYLGPSGNLNPRLITGATFDSMETFQYSTTGYSPSGTIATWKQYSDSEMFPKSNIDFMGGFHLFGDAFTWGRSGEHMKNILMTLDLNSMTDDTLFRYGPLIFHKDLDNHSVVVRSIYSDELIPIYYDYANALNNTYQIEISDQGITLYYVGPWPGVAGRATAYHTYDDIYLSDAYLNAIKNGVDQVQLWALNSTNMADALNPPMNLTKMIPTPTMRFDAAQARGYEIPVISNATYSPGNFKSNPGTEISKIEQYGSSISFGGNTYTVNSNGTITLASKNIPIEGMLFSSHFNGTTYDNEINGIAISTSASPATITFNGKWSASVSTDSYSENTYDVTKWVPGKFAWQGVDTNFKMAGLLASLGAFIALAIYGRRSGARVLPLLLVCAGAGLMFLVMI